MGLLSKDVKVSLGTQKVFSELDVSLYSSMISYLILSHPGLEALITGSFNMCTEGNPDM